MSEFPFNPKTDYDSLLQFVTVFVPGSGGNIGMLDKAVPTASGDAILQEDGFYILQEDGSYILLE